MSKVKNAFENKKAFIPFITAGDPDAESTVRFVLAAARAGADLIEIGIPFSDPTAEGPVIQEADSRALAAGMTLRGAFDVVRKVRAEDPEIPLAFMTYLNPVFKYRGDTDGSVPYEPFLAECSELGIDALIIPDLPFEEQEEILPYTEKYGVDIIFTTPVVEIARVKAATKHIHVFAPHMDPLRPGRGLADTLPESLWGADGLDKVVFTAATNTGTDAAPINKIASGGELARFMLALKVNLATSENIPTLVFDEVDSAIGGATASAVGERLARLARENCQVLVITHSPQVASFGAHHFRVEKGDIDGKTITTVRELSDSERREEIARMLSGAEITDASRAAAVELLKNRMNA